MKYFCDNKDARKLTWLLSQYNFRMNALAGLLPGVKKASW
jgi:ribosomal protein S14